MRKEGSGLKQHPRESGGGEDATAQDQAAEELRKSEARFRNLADTAPAMLWVTEPDGSRSFISRGWYEFTGQTEQEGLGQNGFGWLGAVHPDDREQSEHMFQDANKARRPFSLDYRLRRHDGEYHWAIDAGHPRFGPNSEFLGYIGSVLDITDRKEAEQAQTLLIKDLNRSQQYFRALFNWTPSAVGISTVAEGRLCDVNEGFSRLTGYTREELLGRTTLELGLWTDPSERVTVLREIQNQGYLHNREGLLRTKSGEIRSLMVTVDSIQLGSTPCLIYVAHDMTDRKRAEEALKQSEEQFASLVRSTEDGIVTLDRLGLITFWNPGAEKLFGYAQDEVLGKPMALLMPERFRERHERGIERASAAGHLTAAGKMFELVGLRKDGTEFPTEISVSSWNTRDEVFFTGIIRDITERKMSELALQQNQEELRSQQTQLHELTANLLTAQEEERRRIARDLHDEFSQRLAALTIDLQSLSRKTSESDSSGSSRLKQLGDSAEQLTTDLQRLAHQLHSSLLEQVGLEAAARELAEEFSARTGATTEIVVRNLWDAVPLEQATCLYRVLQESLQNVRKHAEAASVLVRLVGTARGVGLCIYDDGRGFERSPEVTSRKGLGLTSMAERVKALQGTFHVWTKTGQGTEIHAWVPFRKGQATADS
ncbi:MAG: PAS domain S-box protein [Nitrospira sp.]|nr:PAS domain S-box protein [Nitrospira sp.]